MSRIINFDIDEETERRLVDLAAVTGIKNNAGTIRFLINQAWQATLMPLVEKTKEETIEQDIERRR